MDEQRSGGGDAQRLIEQPRQRIGGDRLLAAGMLEGALGGVARDLHLQHPGMGEHAFRFQLARVREVPVEGFELFAGGYGQLTRDLLAEIGAHQIDAGEILPARLLGPGDAYRCVRALLDGGNRAAGIERHRRGDRRTEHGVARLELQRVGNRAKQPGQGRADPLGHLRHNLRARAGELPAKLV